MSDQPRRYTSFEVRPLPWPMPEPVSESASVTRWTLAFGWPLTREDVDTVVERVGMHDPSLEMDVTITDDSHMVVAFTWNSDYDAEALSRSVVALKLLADVIGRPIQLQGTSTKDWPFLNSR